jgi:hypothetical protein
MLVRRQARTAAAEAWGEARSTNRTALRPRPAGILARLRRVRQRWVSPAAALAHDNEYAFLLERLIDAATLRRAHALAASSAVPVHEVLIANGWIAEADYTRAAAAAFGLPAVEGAPLTELSPSASYPPRPSVMAGIFEGREVVAVEARSFAPRVGECQRAAEALRARHPRRDRTGHRPSAGAGPGGCRRQWPVAPVGGLVLPVTLKNQGYFISRHSCPCFCPRS